ncbi:MAG TPA: SDR family NAD(P)-dependent oxidoreductase [Verrucomicrobiae bacterium]
MSSGKLNGKIAVITGGSRGLGKAMALALANEGAHLALLARDENRLKAVTDEIMQAGGTAEYFLADVTDQSQVHAARQAITRRFGQVNILINNAGINIRKPLTEYTLAEWHQVMNANLTSVYLMCHAFIPHMTGRGYGRILNMTSMLSHVALPGRVAYCTSKAGLLGFTKALALELSSEKITVNGISPGPFGTEMNQVIIQNPEANQQFLDNLPVNRWGNVKEIGALAVFLCSEDAGFITGTDMVIDGGWTAR